MPENGDAAASFVAHALSSAGILAQDDAEAFGGIYSRFVRQQQRRRVVELDWDQVSDSSTRMVQDHAALEKCPADPAVCTELLRKVAVLKLNGGLGASMGCSGPKSSIPVRGDQSFLDLTCKQVEYLNAKFGVDVPLLFMDSFLSHGETVALLSKYAAHNLSITCFVQSTYPRIDASTFMPLPTGAFEEASKESWYPPGHGDVYRALVSSGVLDALLLKGIEFIFISNVDNCGAGVDVDILWTLAASADIDFCMEVVDRARADSQGGALVDYDGKPRLLELNQIPPEHLPDFKRLRWGRNFNSNNLWVRARAIPGLVAAAAAGDRAAAGYPSDHSKGAAEWNPPVIVNERLVGGRTVIELETAAGAAVEHFAHRSLAIRVPRSRFLPVKNTSDLLAVQSNLFEVRHGLLLPNPLRGALPPPVIKLGPWYTKLRDYNDRFGQGVPDLLELEHLTVQVRGCSARRGSARPSHDRVPLPPAGKLPLCIRHQARRLGHHR